MVGLLLLAFVISALSLIILSTLVIVLTEIGEVLVTQQADDEELLA